MKSRRFLSLFLSLLLASSVALTPLGAGAEEIEKDKNEKGADDEFSFAFWSPSEAANSENYAGSDDSSFGISDIRIEENAAYAIYYAEYPAALVVGLYDEETGEMLSSGSRDIDASDDATIIMVYVETENIPEKFDVRGFIVDENYNPLCEKYELNDCNLTVSDSDDSDSHKETDTDSDSSDSDDKDSDDQNDTKEKTHEDETSALMASGDCGKDVHWALYENGTLYVYGEGEMTSHPWDEYKNYIETIVIENGVTSICRSAFYECRNAAEVFLGNTLSEIGGTNDWDGVGVFQKCDLLSKIIIPDSVKTIGKYAFKSCTNLHEVEFGNGTTTVGSSAFANCENLQTVKIPDQKFDLVLSDNMFSGCSSLSELSLGKGITSVGDYAFSDCVSLEKIELPEGVKSIGRASYYNCRSVESVSLPSTLTSIGGTNDWDGVGAFQKCDLLSEVIIPDNVSTIGKYAFKGCTNLSKVVFGTGITTVGNGAFANCESLKTVTIPDLKYDLPLSDGLFEGDSNLSELSLGTGITSVGDYTFSGCESLTKVELPEGVKSIGRASYYNCRSVESVSLPSTLTSIGGTNDWDGVGAFQKCDRLSEIIIPDNVGTIGKCAFRGCDDLNKVVFGKGITTIGNNAFAYCESLKTVTIPDLKYKLDLSDGIFEGDINLSELSLGTGIVSVGDYAFNGCESLTKVELPEGVKSIGRASYYNCRSVESISLPSTLTSIGSTNDWDGVGAFQKCDRLSEIIIPDNVGTIGKCAFRGCDDLNKVVFGKGITTIGNNAFAYCESLKTVTIPDLKYKLALSDGIFEGDKNLSELNLGTGITSVGDYAFNGCESLTKVELPEGVKSIGRASYYNCKSVESVTLPSTLTYIGGTNDWNGVGAFQKCELLSKIIIPNSVRTIGKCAFSDCSNLSDVYYTGTESQWSEITISDGNDSLINSSVHFNSSLNSSGSSNRIYASSEENTVEYKTIEKEYTNLVPNGRYIFVLVKSEDAENLLSSDNLVYADQFTADLDGNLIANYPASYGDEYIMLIFGGKTTADDSDKGQDSEIEKIVGDLDGDEEVTSNDAIIVLRLSIVESDYSDSILLIADADDDGEITSNDAILILRASIGQEDLGVRKVYTKAQ